MQYLPNFFILGAPKCGTTSMTRWLAEHPAVYMSPVKEPHYYSTDLAARSVMSPGGYFELFRGATSKDLAIGEASTWYLFSREAVPAIERAHPDARYIVMTRDPVGMAQSLHHHNLRVLHEDQKCFESAWRLQSERARGRSIPPTCPEPKFLQYYDACSLGSQLQRLYQNVPQKRVLHVTLKQMELNPREVYLKILNFLEVPDDRRQQFLSANEARGYKSYTLQKLVRWGGRLRMVMGVHRGLGLSRLNDKPQPKAVISDSFRDELEMAFAKECELLAALTPEYV